DPLGRRLDPPPPASLSRGTDGRPGREAGAGGGEGRFEGLAIEIGRQRGVDGGADLDDGLARARRQGRRRAEEGPRHQGVAGRVDGSRADALAYRRRRAARTKAVGDGPEEGRAGDVAARTGRAVDLE